MKKSGFKQKIGASFLTKKSSLKRSGFKKSVKVSLRKGKLRKVGKVGRANIEANKILRTKLGHIESCEIRLEGCLGNWLLQFAHRHKRAWYKGDVAKLSDIKQVVVGCQNCHNEIEHDYELTEAVFQELRGDE